MISSRTLLLGLIGLNLLVLLWLLGLLPVGVDSQRDPDRLINQIEPDKLNMVRPGETGKPAPQARATPTEPAPQAQASVPAGPDPMPEGAGSGQAAGMPGLTAAADQIARGAGTSAGAMATPSVATVGFPDRAGAAPANQADNCVLFPETDFLQARQQIEQFVPSLARARLRRLDAGSYIVFLEPLESTEAAQDRRDGLVANGIANAQVITTGALRDGISLGLLRTVDEAERRLREVNALGVEQATIGPLSVATSRYRVEMNADAVVIEQSVRPAALAAGITLEPCY